nr:hypothetical protein CFP56_65673 [Quercus suber]
MKNEAFMGYQSAAVVGSRYLAMKEKLKEVSANNEDLLKNILDTMTEVTKSKRFRAEVEENIKAITERKDALEKELKGAKKALKEKIAKLAAHVKVNNDQLHVAYYHGQIDCISSMQPEVQKIL